MRHVSADLLGEIAANHFDDLLVQVNVMLAEKRMEP